MQFFSSIPSRLIFTFCFMCLWCVHLPAQTGMKIGCSASSFAYKNSPVPILDFDIDLRPYLGYDIEWVQLGKQKPILLPYLSLYTTLQLHHKLSIRPELSFIQKGVNFNQFDFERIIYKSKNKLC